MEEELYISYKGFLLEFVKNFTFPDVTDVKSAHDRLDAFQKFTSEYDLASTKEANRLIGKDSHRLH